MRSATAGIAEQNARPISAPPQANVPSRARLQRQRLRPLDQHALDAALVGARDVLGQPVLAEDAVGHLDDDVVGLEQAVDEVAPVALKPLQAARARPVSYTH